MTPAAEANNSSAPQTTRAAKLTNNFTQRQPTQRNDGAENNSWHWKHYHAFKTPTFNDYSSPDIDDFDDTGAHLASSSSSSSSSLIAQQNNNHSSWLNLENFATKTTFTGANHRLLQLANAPDRTKTSWDRLAQLSCDSGEMILRLNFSEPFKGIVYPDNNRLSPCRFFGDGHLNYELRLPLRGCGTKQVGQRVFANDVIVRFHKSLELEEDEVKTLICRYPPPLAASSSSLASTLRPSLGEQENGQNQFEFIGEHGKRPTSSVESSDNLLAAPPGGQHSNSYGGTVQELQQVPAGYGKNLLPFQQQNSPDKTWPTTTAIGARQNADLIDQRSSPAPTDAFFNGQPTRASTGGGLTGYFERLSSIELLFLISSLMFLILLGLGLAGGYLCFRRQAANERRASAILRRKRRLMGAGGAAGFMAPPLSNSAGLLQAAQAAASLRQPHQQYRPHQPLYYHQRHHAAAAAAPPSASSPESDLSARGLLASAGGAGGHLRRPHEQQHAAYMFSNRAFVPDAGHRSMSHKRAYGGASSPPPPPPVLGRRADAGLHAHPSYRSVQARPVEGRHALMPARKHHQLYSTSDNLAPHTAKHGGGGCKQQGLHWAQQVHVDGAYGAQPADTNDDGAPLASLSRAKSLSCVAGQQVPDLANQQLFEGGGGSNKGGRQRWQPLPIGGTLARYQRAKESHRAHHQHPYHHPQHHAGRHSHLDSLLAADRSRVHRSSSPAGNAWLQMSSDSEIEPNNNNNSGNRIVDGQTNASKQAPKGEGKLFLKSIEDSYITKFTEVEQQEYMKRDSLRPLGLTEWREKIAEQQQQRRYRRTEQPAADESASAGHHQDQQAQSSRPLVSEASSYRSSASETSELPSIVQANPTSEAPPMASNSPDEAEYRSTNTNLRSLTELDVNFAKSLLRTNRPASFSTETKPSGSEVNQESQEVEAGRGQKAIEDCDLVVSPEYDLELAEEPTGANASRNTVSYV